MQRKINELSTLQNLNSRLQLQFHSKAKYNGKQMTTKNKNPLLAVRAANDCCHCSGSFPYRSAFLGRAVNRRLHRDPSTHSPPTTTAAEIMAIVH